MKILQVVHRFPPERIAGTELYTRAISRGLLDRGHQCFVLAGTDQAKRDGTLTSGVEDGVHVTRVAGSGGRGEGWFPAYDPEMEECVRGYVGDLKPDVVHIQHWVNLTANLIAVCGESGCPTVVTLHDLAVICPRGDRLRFDKVFCIDPLSEAPCLICVQREPWQTDDEVQGELALRQQMVEEGLRLADRLLVPSRAQKDFLLMFLDVEADRLEVLPHGTLHDLRPRRASGEGTPRRPLRLGYWGHLLWQKGPHLLLEAVKKLSDPSAVEVHLIGEAGDPAYRQELEALAENLPVTFHGPFQPNDLEKLALDVAVFPSLCHESHSFVCDEAFQLDLPVIVSDRGALGERVGSAGLTFTSGVVEDLAAQIERLITQPALMEQLRTAIPNDPPHPMSEHVVALEKIYEDVVRSSRGTSVSRPDYHRILVLRQRQLSEREAAIRHEQARFHELHARSREYQARLERDVETAKSAYQQVLAEAREYQARLERDVETAKSDYQRLLGEAQAFQGKLEGQVRSISQERDQLKQALDSLQSYPEIKLYARVRERLFRRRPKR
ncbi:MAG: glycosyltransferase [Candidatus Methylomirabilaceae bacterium]